MIDDAVLAIDVGTSSIRAAVVTREGRVVDRSRTERSGHDTDRTFDAEALWGAVVDTITALDQAARRSCSALAVAAHLGTVLVDDRLRPVGSAAGWADRTGVDAFSAALALVSAEEFRATGRPTVAPGPVSALLGLRDTDPRAERTVAHALSPKDFLVARLTGVVATDHTSAAYTGAADVARRSWSVPVLDAVGVDPAMLGVQRSATDVIGPVRDDLAARTGLPRGLPVVAGGPDGTVGLTFLLGAPGDDFRAPGVVVGAPDAAGPDGVGGDALESGSDVVGDVAGTTDVVAMRRRSLAEAPAAAVVNPYPLGGWTFGGPTGMTGGAVTHWARLLGFRDAADAVRTIGDEIDAVGTGADGLSASVALSGSRFPNWDDAARGGLSGMTERHGRAHVLRAVIEAGARSVADAIATLPAGSSAPVVLAGGAARSPLLVRIRADVLGRSVLACAEPDVTLMGAALLAALGTAPAADRSELLDRFRPEGTVVDPAPSGRTVAPLGVR